METLLSEIHHLLAWWTKLNIYPEAETLAARIYPNIKSDLKNKGNELYQIPGRSNG